MAKIVNTLRETLDSSTADTDIVASLGGTYTLALLGDLDGGTLNLYWHPDQSQTTKASFGAYRDDAGTAITLSGASAATHTRARTIDLPRGNYYLGVTGGGGSESIEVSMTILHN